MHHQWRSAQRFIAFGLLLFFEAASAQQAHAPVGVNLSGVADWSTQLVFVDVFKQSREWIPQRVSGGAWNTGEALSLTADGWIASLASGQAAGTLMTREILGHYPAGLYICLYDGEGQIEFGFDAAVLNRQPGRITLNVAPGNGGIYLKMTATNSANPIRNIRVIMPGFENAYNSQPFHPLFLQRLRKFKVLRFMDWARTNDSPLVNWNQRATPDYVSQGHEKGVALEYMIALANTLQAEPWFCLPHQADDDYVRQFAMLVKNTLDPNLKVYIEYSNEVWNNQFAQARYAQTRGLALGLSANAYEAQLRYYSQRAVEIFKIWEEVYQGKEKLVRILASQNANPWTGTTILDWKNASQRAEALAVAPYFGGYLGAAQWQSRVQSMSVNQILDSCAVDIGRAMAYAAENKKNAAARGLALIAYEAGQHLAGFGGVENDQTITNLFIAANRHPGMKLLYLDYLQRWDRMGGGLIAMFSFIGLYSKWGSWGLLEWQDQDAATAPKYQAVQDFIAGTTGVELDEILVPQNYYLSQNFPNPFLDNGTFSSAGTTIRYAIGDAQFVSLKVYDVLGNEVTTLVHQQQTPGEYWARFNANGLPGGAYFYKLIAGHYRQVKKLLLIRTASTTH